MRLPVFALCAFLALSGSAAAEAIADNWDLTSGMTLNRAFSPLYLWTPSDRPPLLATGTAPVSGMTSEAAVYLRGNTLRRSAGLRPRQRAEPYQIQGIYMGFGGLENRLPLEAWRGKRVQISLRLRNEGQVQAWASAQINKSNNAASRSFAQVNDAGEEWQDRRFVLDVPDTATELVILVGLAGSGTVWIDGGTLEAVSRDVPLSRTERIQHRWCDSCRFFDGPVAAMPGRGRADLAF